MSSSRSQTGGNRWRVVALPTEHGGWGFISEPIILGLLLAPGGAALTLSIAALAAFLLRQPLKLYLKDRRAGRNVPRTRLARRFVLIYGSILVSAGGLTLLLTPTLTALLPLLLTLPFLSLQLLADMRSQSRTLAAEMAGSIAPGVLASAIVLMQDWALLSALGLWLALAIKAVTAVLYVRARLRLEYGKDAPRRLAVGAHLVGLALLMGAAGYGVLPWTAPLAMSLLLGRATLGLSALRRPRPARIIGMQEIAYGLIFVVLIALGHLLG